MKKLATLILICCYVVAQGQHKETRKIETHTAIAVSTGIDVIYIQSNKNEAIIECENKNHIDLLLTTVKAGTLEIRYRPNSSVSSKKPTKVTVYANGPLSSAKVSASGTLTLNNALKASTFKLEASSSGKIITQQIEAAKITIEASSSGKIKTDLQAVNVAIEASSASAIQIAGKADNIRVAMSSSATVDLPQMEIGALVIEGSSLSSLTFYTAASLKNKLSSSAKVYFTKAPIRITQNILSSGGQFIKK